MYQYYFIFTSNFHMRFWLKLEYFIGTVCVCGFSKGDLQFLEGKGIVLFISVNLIYNIVLIK